MKKSSIAVLFLLLCALMQSALAVLSAPCTTCGNRVKGNSVGNAAWQLKAHEATHNPDTPRFTSDPCPICTKTYQSSSKSRANSNLKRHQNAENHWAAEGSHQQGEASTMIQPVQQHRQEQHEQCMACSVNGYYHTEPQSMMLGHYQTHHSELLQQ